jgi:RNA polymerase sigma factor (sigma-70 family)
MAPSDTRPSPGTERNVRVGALLERARTGDRPALDEIVRELSPVLWRVARSQGLDADTAADVVQTTWLELLGRIGEIRSPQALTSWLVTTARRESWRLKDRARRTSGPAEVLDVLPDPGPAPDHDVLVEERDRSLHNAFRLLPERCRRLLSVLAQVDRPDYAVVSEALGMPHGSIGPTRGRCLAKLRDLLLADPGWSTT